MIHILSVNFVYLEAVVAEAEKSVFWESEATAVYTIVWVCLNFSNFCFFRS